MFIEEKSQQLSIEKVSLFGALYYFTKVFQL
jgi:hypothetical protein